LVSRECARREGRWRFVLVGGIFLCLFLLFAGSVGLADVVDHQFRTTIPLDGSAGGEVAGFVDVFNPEPTPVTLTSITGTFLDIDICDDDELAQWRLPYVIEYRRQKITLAPEETVRLLFPAVMVCSTSAANAAAHPIEGRLDFGVDISILPSAIEEGSPTAFRAQHTDEVSFERFLSWMAETDLRVVFLDGTAQRTPWDTDGDGPTCPGRLSGTWESVLILQPAPFTLLDFSHEFAVTYLVGGIGDWRLTSRSTFDETGLTVQQFEMQGYLDAHIPRVRLTALPDAPQSTSLILDWQVGIAGVNILYQAIYEANQCGYSFSLQGQTPRDDAYLSNRALTPLSFWFTGYFNATKANPNMPLDYVRYGPYPYKNYILSDCEDGISFTGFEARVQASLLDVELWIDPADSSGVVEFFIDDTGFSWLDLHATFEFEVEEIALSLYPRFYFPLEDEVCFQPYVQILFSEGAEGFHIDGLQLFGLYLSAESDGLALRLSSTWVSGYSADSFSVTPADDDPCWEEDFAFYMNALFQEGAPGPFGLSQLQIRLSTLIAPRFVPFRLDSFITINFNYPPGSQWTQWIVEFEVPLGF
jgi:hypothetical protein